MPNNASARRDKEKKKRRGETSQSPPQQGAEESVESFLSRSATDSGFQDDVEDVTWESVAEQAAMDDSLTSLSRPPSSLESKATRREEKRRRRKLALQKELDDESDIPLKDEENAEEQIPKPRTLSLSPSEFDFLQRRSTKPLGSNLSILQGAMGNPPVFSSPSQDSEGKRKEASADVPSEAIASMIASGAISVQRDSQGLPQGSSSFSIPSPTFNLPPTERAQVLQRSLAAELFQPGSGRSLPITRETLAGARHGHPH